MKHESQEQRSQAVESQQSTEQPVEITPQAKERMRRRRLLKGLVAAGSGLPVVMTMKNASATAASSADSTCHKEFASTPATRCGATLNPAETPDYYRVAETDALFGANVSAGTAGAGATNEYCVVYVDSSGVPASQNAGAANLFGATAGNAAPDTNYYAMTDSCWSSFNGA